MTKLNITRLPGESEEDFQRRYTREKMRLYRARKPKAPPKPRGKNTKPPKNSPVTPEEWAAAQQRPDEPNDDYRKRSQRERTARYRQLHAERLRAERLADYAENKAEIRVQVAQRKARNPEVYKATQRRHFERNRPKKIAALKAWVAENPEKHKAAKEKWGAENKGLLASYSAKWRRECREATPPWADFDIIRLFYEEARRMTLQTGIQHEVDHIIPVAGRLVRGLHVQTNLRIITASLNCKKRNRFDPELAAVLGSLEIW